MIEQQAKPEASFSKGRHMDRIALSDSYPGDSSYLFDHTSKLVLEIVLVLLYSTSGAVTSKVQ